VKELGEEERQHDGELGFKPSSPLGPSCKTGLNAPAWLSHRKLYAAHGDT
jgi:hypothetical protein